MNKPRTVRSLVLAALCAILIAGCAKQDQTASLTDTAKAVSSASIKSGNGLGVVTAIDTVVKTIALSHGDVPGIMEAMSMSYPVGSSNLFRGIHVGDSVRFTLGEKAEGEFVINAIAPIPKQ